MKARHYKVLTAAVISLQCSITACVKDLDTIPLDQDVLTTEKIYTDYSTMKRSLQRSMPDWQSPDREVLTEPMTSAVSMKDSVSIQEAYFYAQELPTDEAILGWNDGNLRDYQEMDWSASNEFIFNMYSRIFYQISLCNEFIRETTDAKLNDRGFQ